MHYLRPVIWFALSGGIVSGQQLANPTNGFDTSSLSWMSKYERIQSSRDSSEHEAARKRAAFPAAPSQKEFIADINLSKLSGSTLASIYRACTGRRVIVSAAAANAEFSLVHEASPQHPISYDQAAELIKKSATLEGFIFAPDSSDSNLDIFALAKGTRIICRGVAVYNENTPLPGDDKIISYVMTLNYLRPNKAIAIFTKSVGNFESPSSIAIVPHASAIVVTHRTSIIRKLVRLKNEMDKPQ